MEITGDARAQFVDNVRNVFQDLGRGARVYLFHPSNGPSLWIIPLPGTRFSHYYEPAKTIDPLVNNGLVVKKPIENREMAPGLAEAVYELTDKGWQLWINIEGQLSVEWTKILESSIDWTVKKESEEPS